MRRAQDGDEGARAELVRRVYPLVVRWARVRTGGRADAEDVAHDALVRVLGRLGTFRGEARFTSWVYRVVRNVAVDRGQRRTRREGREVDLERAGRLPSTATDPVRLTERRELLERVRQAFMALPPRQREVFDMADLQGLTSPEIAEKLGIAPSSVRVTLLNARRSVRRALLERDPALGEDRS
ncbi:MAG TPA: sigma-70 family RNA polymerase sigma factor [Longimicrobiales bacterium]|nr:sigma-70 family RNA polymerase sigma factor [Longimicrobiales bacterium]